MENGDNDVKAPSETSLPKVKADSASATLPTYKGIPVWHYLALFCSLCCLLLIGGFVVRYATAACLEPFVATLSDLKLPAIIVVIFGVALAVFGDDSWKNAVAGLTARVLASGRLAGAFVVLSVLSCLFVAATVPYLVPKEWRRFIEQDYLDGEQDDYARASATVMAYKTLSDDDRIVLQSGIQLGQLVARQNHLPKYDPDLPGKVDAQVAALVRRTGSNDLIEAFRLYSLCFGFQLQGEQYPYRSRVFFDACDRTLREFNKMPNHSVSGKWRDAGIFFRSYALTKGHRFREAAAIIEAFPDKVQADYGNLAYNYLMLGDDAKCRLNAEKGFNLLKGIAEKKSGNYAVLASAYILSKTRTDGPIVGLKTFQGAYADSITSVPEDVWLIYGLLAFQTEKKDEYGELLSDNSPLQLQNRSLLKGIVAATIGEQSAAVDHFKVFLGIDTDVPTDIVIAHTTARIEDVGLSVLPVVKQGLAKLRQPHEGHGGQ